MLVGSEIGTWEDETLSARDMFKRSLPRGSIYTTIMELGPKRPSLLWFWWPNSIMGVYLDPLCFVF